MCICGKQKLDFTSIQPKTADYKPTKVPPDGNSVVTNGAGVPLWGISALSCELIPNFVPPCCQLALVSIQIQYIT